MKVKELIAVVKAMCDLQNERNAAYVKFDKLEQSYNLALEEINRRLDSGLENRRLRDQLDELLDKHAELEQLHAADITWFKSNTELLQTKLNAAKQEVAYFKHVLSSLSCVTVDAVAHCDVEHAESLRTFIGLVKEHVVLSIQDRVQLDTMLSNLDHAF